MLWWRLSVAAGARQVYLIDEPIAAALGSGIDITMPDGRMIIDIGGGTTDIAVLSLGGKVKATSVRVAGNHYDEEILKFVRNKFSIAIGQRTAENLKRTWPAAPEGRFPTRPWRSRAAVCSPACPCASMSPPPTSTSRSCA